MTASVGSHSARSAELAPTALSFVVPLPPRELSPNRTRNEHWSGKSEAVAAYRQLAMVQAHNAAVTVQWTNPAKCRVSLVFGLKDQSVADKACYHPRDADNAVASVKALVDGMVDAMVLESDRWANMELGSVTADKLRPASVYVTVEAV